LQLATDSWPDASRGEEGQDSGNVRGILRFFDIQAISHQEALVVLSFLEARLQSCFTLVSNLSLVQPVL